MNTSKLVRACGFVFILLSVIFLFDILSGFDLNQVYFNHFKDTILKAGFMFFVGLSLFLFDKYVLKEPK